MKITATFEFEDMEEAAKFMTGKMTVKGLKKAEAPIEENTEEPDLLGDGEPEEEPQGATIEQIRALVTLKTKKEKKTEAVVKLLTKYGADNVTLLDKKHYQKFFDALGKL